MHTAYWSWNNGLSWMEVDAAHLGDTYMAYRMWYSCPLPAVRQADYTLAEIFALAHAFRFVASLLPKLMQGHEGAPLVGAGLGGKHILDQLMQLPKRHVPRPVYASPRTAPPTSANPLILWPCGATRLLCHSCIAPHFGGG